MEQQTVRAVPLAGSCCPMKMRQFVAQFLATLVSQRGTHSALQLRRMELVALWELHAQLLHTTGPTALVQLKRASVSQSQTDQIASDVRLPQIIVRMGSHVVSTLLIIMESWNEMGNELASWRSGNAVGKRMLGGTASAPDAVQRGCVVA